MLPLCCGEGSWIEENDGQAVSSHDEPHDSNLMWDTLTTPNSSDIAGPSLLYTQPTPGRIPAAGPLLYVTPPLFPIILCLMMTVK